MERVPYVRTATTHQTLRARDRGESADHETSLGKGLDLLAAIAEFDEPVGVTELAERTGRPKSTVHRMLGTMTAMRVVEQVVDGRYAIGLRLFEIGSRAAVRISLRDIAAPELRDLTERLDETSHLGVLDGDEVVYVEKVEGSASIRMSSQVGHRNPLYCTGIGKALLAFAGEEAIEAVCRAGLATRSKGTITDPTALREDLALTRARGYSIDDEEVEAGLRCVGAPVFSADGETQAAISVAGPAMRMGLDRCEEIGPELTAAATRIGRALGSLGSNRGAGV